MRITVNVCRDFGSRRRRQSLAAEFKAPGVTNANPYSDLASDERYRCRDAIAGLPSRNVPHLFYATLKACRL